MANVVLSDYVNGRNSCNETEGHDYLPLFVLRSYTCLSKLSQRCSLLVLVLYAKQNCVISGFRRRMNETFGLLGCYVAVICSYRRFGTTYRSHLQGSSSLLGLPDP